MGGSGLEIIIFNVKCRLNGEKSGKKTGTPGIVPGKETCTIWGIYSSATVSPEESKQEDGGGGWVLTIKGHN